MTRKRMPSVQRLTACGLLGLGLTLVARPAPSAPPSTKPKFTYQSLGTLGGATSTAEGINDVGDVVGVSDLAGGGSSPYVWTAGEGMQDLNVVTEGPLDSPGQPRFGPDRNGDSVQDLYVVSIGFEAAASHVTVFDGVDGRYVEHFISAGSGGLSATAYMYIAPDGDFYIPSGPAGAVLASTRNRVLRYDGTTGAFLGEFVTPNSGGLSGASGLAFGTDVNDDGVSDLFVASTQTNNVLVYSGTDGAFLSEFVVAGSGGMDRPGDVLFVRDFDGDGVTDLLVSSRDTAAVLAYSGLDGAFIDEFVEPLNIEQFNQMAVGPDGDLYVASNNVSGTVHRFDGATGASKGVFVPTGAGGLNGPAPFMGFDPQGDFYVSSNNTNQVMRFEGPLSAIPGEFVEVFVTGVGFVLSSARDINNAGQMVGTGYPLGRRNDFGPIAAYRYTPPAAGDDIGNAIDLGLPGNTAEEATGINDDGDVAGHFVSPTDGKYHAFLWSETTGPIDLGTLSGQNTFATAITNRNGSGDMQISGYAGTSGGDRAWRYDTATGVMQNLGLISGSSGASRAWDINDAGTATGHASAGTKTHAFTRTLSGGMVDLGTLGGNNSYAAGINDVNTVVGMSDTSTKAAQNKFQAFMRTTANGMFKLEPQITNLPGSMLLKIRPTRVSDAGQVIGPGSFDPPGTAFVLTPQ